MRVSQWAQAFAAQPALTEAFSHLEGKLIWREIPLEARPFVLAAACLQAPRKILLVTSTYEKALQWQAKLALCGVPEQQMRQLPSGISALFEDAAPETTALSDRIGALRFLIDPGPGIVLATAQAALERTLPKEVIEQAFITVEIGQEIEGEQLLSSLALLGYEVAEPVRLPGQYSRRGGIIDIFAMGGDLPVRIELFGDQVESIRVFDPNTQRSVGNRSSLKLAPSRETLYAFDLPQEETIQARKELAEMIRRSAHQESANLSANSAKQLEELISDDANAIEAGVFFDRLDLYRPLLHPDSGCAVDLLGEQGLLVLDEVAEVDILASKAEGELAEALEHRAERGEILSSTANDFMIPPDHFDYAESVLGMCMDGVVPEWLTAGRDFWFNAESLQRFQGQSESLTKALKEWIKKGYCVLVGTDQPTRAKSVLNQIDVFPADSLEDDLEIGPGVFMAQGNLAGGFVAPDNRFALLTDQELFGVGRLKLPQRKFNEGTPIATVLDLKPGDYVVHIHFGIGVFQGLTKRTIDGIEKEFLFIQYQAPDKLFVPADQLDRVQKYLNPGDAEPKLNRLTGGEWKRAVGKAREEAREFARDLIKLYAERKKAKRQPIGPDSPWQAEMETTFPWMETPSQLQAIKETKKDLELEYPMDRLVCGDVGFGKTEVAIRAAFKVAQAGKQVAVLCPTTILSEQHYRNFHERLGAFPVRVELLNRFRTGKDRKEIIGKLERGEIDIIIGTHALLSTELKFKQLGLVIIDEEQKFGVKQKEALKALRVSVDVLTLSATPIPRTLSMALMDIRQMSLINDPPPGRLPIRTYLKHFSKEIVREAILRELARGGQVYYVFNRVQGIYHVADALRKLIPTARIGVGHGQMSEKELEPVMLAFIKGEIDVLLSTTIVESGLDIPNANTIIVENADRLGLAQLYQLRGRVGRSDRQAYAYLLYHDHRTLTENALARLHSLREFSSLGSGYSLAFRDLQIRGAGDLLGAKQSGTMASVGYELFTQIINEEVRFLKTHAEGSDKTEYRDPLEGLLPLPTIDLPVQALILESYISDQAQRLYYYKQMMSARSPEELQAVHSDIVDRYGHAPEEVLRALSIMRLRLQARDLQIDKIEGRGGRLLVHFREDSNISPRVWTLMGKRHRECYLSTGNLIWPFTGGPINACEMMLKTLQESIDEVERQRASLQL